VIHSHSSLQQFRTCPKQFYHERVAKDVAREEPGEAAAWGLLVHKAMENAILLGHPLPSNMVQYQKYLDAVMALPGEKFCELKLGMTKDWEPVDFFSPDCWFRGIADVIIDNNEEINAVDWKLGKRVQDDEQAKLTSALIFANFPNAKIVKTRWIYMIAEQGKRQTYYRDATSTLMRRAKGTMSDVEWAFKHDSWPAQPSGLCGRYCSVLSCQHNGRR